MARPVLGLPEPRISELNNRDLYKISELNKDVYKISEVNIRICIKYLH